MSLFLFLLAGYPTPVPRVLVGFSHHRLVGSQPYRHDLRPVHATFSGDQDLRLEQEGRIAQPSKICGEWELHTLDRLVYFWGGGARYGGPRPERTPLGKYMSTCLSCVDY